MCDSAKLQIYRLFFLLNSLAVRISRFLSVNNCRVVFPKKNKVWNYGFEFACLQTDAYQPSYANRIC